MLHFVYILSSGSRHKRLRLLLLYYTGMYFRSSYKYDYKTAAKCCYSLTMKYVYHETAAVWIAIEKGSYERGTEDA